ncbi:hypothetical protein FB554_0899 [Barrientosiimonas humi]|uniref:Uncharacterized protein n=1 Tax=Barrientosiimonas humi TaxID=999931 RepID=A0A542XAB9_9MICO|nr:hypothetical protein FB554_0899 [Barrientosiimonas humi]CAG7572758.1 hypothetical protein BH39T_PBIAJDOK_01381 [Barrientosiimonas humi]
MPSGHSLPVLTPRNPQRVTTQHATGVAASAPKRGGVVGVGGVAHGAVIQTEGDP